MKQHRLFRVMCLATILLVAACALTACGDSTDVVVTTPTDTATPTEPVPLGQMTLADLTRLMKPTMAWSAIKMYDHTAVDATHAVFEVSDGNGNLCTLNVTFDEATDTISQADISYGDLTLNALTDSTAVIRDIMVAIRQATEQ